MKSKKPIEWGETARKIKAKDICRGQARSGDQQDYRGWAIEFFGENTRAETVFSRKTMEKAGISIISIEMWSDDATIKEQVQIFNDCLKDLKVLSWKSRSKEYGIYKVFKNGKRAKKPLISYTSPTKKEALEAFEDEREELGYNKEELPKFKCEEIKVGV